MSDTAKISVSEWMAELNELEQLAGEDGATTAELAASSGMTEPQVRRKIRLAVNSGEWEHVRVARKQINGQVRLTDGYRPKQKPARRSVRRPKTR